MLVDAVKMAHPDTKEVTSIRTIALLFSQSSIYMGMLGKLSSC